MATKKDESKPVKKKTKAEPKTKAKAEPKTKAEPKAEHKTKVKPKEKLEAPKVEDKTDPERGFHKEALALARRLDSDYLLFICDENTPLEELDQRSMKKKVIVASASERQRIMAEEMGLAFEILPAYAFERFEKINIALGACVSSGKLQDGMKVLCMVGAPNAPELDTCMMAQVGQKNEEQAALAVLLSGAEYSTQVMEAVLHISMSVGFEGIEGDPVGTIFVVGDSVAVMEKSKQLTLNPFQGYSEDEKNILDPKIRDAVKNFCLLDGAFVIREDGVIMAAGRYLRAPDDLELDLPLGLGTRNAAAMSITKTTKAISFVISKTTGTVRIYKNGELKADLKQPRRRT